EVLEGRRVTVLRAPELADLLQSPGEPGAAGLVGLATELLLHLRRGVLHPGGLSGSFLPGLLRDSGGHRSHENTRENKQSSHQPLPPCGAAPRLSGAPDIPAPGPPVREGGASPPPASRLLSASPPRGKS